MFFGLNLGLGAVLLLLIGLVVVSLRVMREYERGVVFQLGRFWSVKGPGLVLVIPGLQQMVRVDLRVVTFDVPPQDVISRDNVSVQVNAVLFFRVIDPRKAIIQVEDYLVATSQLAQTTLRVVLGKHELDEMLAERERLNLDIQTILDEQTAAWGIKVTNVEIKHIDLNESMIRAIARQAEAERERRAKVIHAEGERQAAAALIEAARMLSERPEAMQLRYLQTMTQVAGDRASTIVLPLPLDLLGSLLGPRGAATPVPAPPPPAAPSPSPRAPSPAGAAPPTPAAPSSAGGTGPSSTDGTAPPRPGAAAPPTGIAPPRPDVASPRHDAGAPRPDAGAPRHDANVPRPDAEAPRSDATPPSTERRPR